MTESEVKQVAASLLAGVLAGKTAFGGVALFPVENVKLVVDAAITLLREVESRRVTS